MGNETCHRPRHTHHQVRGQPGTPRNHPHANRTPRTHSHRDARGRGTRGGGACAETGAKSQRTDTCHLRLKHTCNPALRPDEGVAPRMRSGGCPPPHPGGPPPPPRGRASSPPPSLALPQAWAARSGAGQQTRGSQLKPSREPGSRGSPGPPRRAGWPLCPRRPGSGWQLGPALAGVELGCGSNPWEGEGGRAGQREAGLSLESLGHVAHNWPGGGEGTQPLPLLRQGHSPTTYARPHLTSRPGEVPGEQRLPHPGLRV